MTQGFFRCPHCYKDVHVLAVKCPHCTGEIDPVSNAKAEGIGFVGSILFFVFLISFLSKCFG